MEIELDTALFHNTFCIHYEYVTKSTLVDQINNKCANFRKEEAFLNS